MKLRELFDKLTPGMLDTDVTVRIRSVHETLHPPAPVSSVFRPLEAVEIQDDGSVTLTVTE